MSPRPPGGKYWHGGILIFFNKKGYRVGGWGGWRDTYGLSLAEKRTYIAKIENISVLTHGGPRTRAPKNVRVYFTGARAGK